MFEVRIHCIDYCLVAPTQADRDASCAPIPKSQHGGGGGGGDGDVRVPVIRVFGATPAGPMACAHIHGVFPYLYVPLEDVSMAETDRRIAALRHGIDQAVGRAAVVAVTVVRGIPFYGFHVGFRRYGKIYLYDPGQVARVAEVLRQGRVAGVPALLPHEAHIPFLLQFMTDYNLYGCAALMARAVVQRADAGTGLQVDVAAHSICNRLAVPERRLHTAVPEPPVRASQRLVHSMATLWREMASKYTKQGKKSAAAWEAVATQDAFVQLGASASDPRAAAGAWRHEAEFRAQIADMIAAEGADPVPSARDDLDHLPTMRQAVEDFYPKAVKEKNKKRKMPETGGGQETATDGETGEKSLDEVAPVTATAGATSAPPTAPPAAHLLPTSFDALSPSPDFERQLGLLLDQHEPPTVPTTVAAPGNERLPSSQTSSEMRWSQELPSRKRLHRERDVHRPLSQTFPVVKSAFAREAEPKSSQTTTTDGEPRLSQATITDADSDSDGDGDDGDSVHGAQSALATVLDGYDTTPPAAMMISGDGTTSRSASALDRDSTTPMTATALFASDSFERWPEHSPAGFVPVGDNTVVFFQRPPPAAAVMDTLAEYGPDEEHQDAYYGSAADLHRNKPDQPYPGKPVWLLPKFSSGGTGADAASEEAVPSKATAPPAPPTIRSWEVAAQPPSFDTVAAWLESEAHAAAATKTAAAQAAHAAQQRVASASLSQEERAAEDPSRASGAPDLRTLCVEVQAHSRGAFLPDPARDAVQFVAWQVVGGASGVLSVARPVGDAFRVDVVADEQALLEAVVRLVHALDPDILAGYDTASESWGYLQARAAAVLDVDLWAALGRVQPAAAGSAAALPGHMPSQAQAVTGRYVLAVGDALRGLVALRQYTLENAAWQVLGERVPLYRAAVLTDWVASGRARDAGRAAGCCRRRAAVVAALLTATELVARTSEQARVLGVPFAAVLQRGSQFQVESVLLRVAKPENYALPSPGPALVGRQNAAAVTPLVLEPRSAFYSSPVVVLDFASLYPSLMIAYNLCYSTYLGRLGEGGMKDAGMDLTKMGFTQYDRPPGLLAQLAPQGLVVTPNGFVYAGASTRPSLLGKMLREILETRAMVKAAMQATAGNDTDPTAAADRQRLHNRQLALKLLANVTYGYTSASFSGRMPCVEVADSIVQTGRQTLDRAIALIHGEPRWRAEVVYGDTDSLFVHLPGRTRAQAFAVGAEMAAAVTAANPAPVRLQLEKVYQPCVLLAKKRYVGQAYTRPDQATGTLDAKGIETVRRDGTAAAAQLLDQSLRLFFATADLSRVRACVQAGCATVLEGRQPLLDLCFAREVRGGGAPGVYRAPPPGAVVAARRAAQDPRAAARHRERVPYVVVAGPPGTPLRARCVAPEAVVRQRQLRIDADYYVRKSLLPPLARVFRLVGADVAAWYRDMPRARMPLRTIDPSPTQGAPADRPQQQTLDTWLQGARCARCARPVKRGRRRRRNALGAAGDADAPLLCKRCARDNGGSLRALQARARAAESAYAAVLHACRRCAGLGPRDDVRCENLTCAVYFARAERAVQARAARATAPLMAALAARGMRDLEW